MRMRSEALAWLAAASLAAGACGKGEVTPEGGAEASTGGEAPAAAAPPPSAAAGGPAPAAAAPNPFGSPDAEKGTPLPPRNAMNGSAKSDYEDGIKKARQGDLAGARGEFDSAVKSDPNAFLALHALGVISDREGKESQALDYYRRALRVQPDYEESAQGIVAIYLRQGQSDKALSFMQPLAQQWERNLYLQAYYADLLTEVNRPADAVNVARAALRRDERFVPAMISLIRANLKSGKVELADSIIEQALGVDEQNAELHFIKGKRLVADQRLGDALNEFRRAVELDPDYAEARMELALRLLAGANYDEALTQLQAVDKLTPKLVEVQLALGDAYRSKGQWENAKASFDKALRMRTDLPQAHFNLALMYMTTANNAAAAGATGPGVGYPGMDILTTYNKAKEEFAAYRTQMGPRITRDDPSSGYLDDIDKSIAREQKRLERERKAAERGARSGGSK
ncbi:MAG TPA: tetratricopeptide repeat protein [Polyangiales bacterium]